MAANFVRRRGEAATLSSRAKSTPSNMNHVAAWMMLQTDQWRGIRLSLTRWWRGRVSVVLVILLFLSLWVLVSKSDGRRPFGSKQSSSEGRIVVALSTIPSRIHLLQPTLDSLVWQQTLRPNVVYLTLPQKKAHSNVLLNYTIPNFVKSYRRSGQLRVLTPEYDYGSIMKVLHVLEIEAPDSRIVYVDDDWTYDANMLEVLLDKSLHYYPNEALCFNGGKFRNYFRQIGHTHLENNRHPFLFMETSGTNTLLGGKDHPVDVAQGFCGVLVKPRFFDVGALKFLLQQRHQDVPIGVIKSDDFILSSHLEYRNVTRLLVDGGTPPSLTPAAGIDKLSLYMYRHAIEAAYYLQNYWRVWQNFSFYNPASLSTEEWDAIDCEAGRGTKCDDGSDWRKILRELDQKYPP